ncbi:MAG: 50S ribosomal protein L4 [candidate division WS2 bacterium]|nr:50S ribosomal protein L4 [Candidatus Psychracetigena formicireducens]
MKIKVLNLIENSETELEVEGWDFPVSGLKGAHEVVKSIEANSRQGTLATKSRGDVTGGGKKPWAQKHTGRARHSTIRSPLWRKGGHTFALVPKEYSLKVNSKQKKKVMVEVIGYKAQNGFIFLLEGFYLEKPSTKKAQEILLKLAINGNKSLMVTLGSNELLYKSFRNIPEVKVTTLEELNIRDFLAAKYIVMETEAFKTLIGRSKKWIP